MESWQLPEPHQRDQNKLIDDDFISPSEVMTKLQLLDCFNKCIWAAAIFIFCDNKQNGTIIFHQFECLMNTIQKGVWAAGEPALESKNNKFAGKFKQPNPFIVNCITAISNDTCWFETTNFGSSFQTCHMKQQIYFVVSNGCLWK